MCPYGALRSELAQVLYFSLRIQSFLPRGAPGVSPCFSPLGKFRREELPQRQKFYTDDVNQCLCSKSCGHGVPNVKNLFDFLSGFCFSWSIMVKFCVLLRTSSTKTQMLFLKRNMLWFNFILGLNFTSPCFRLIITHYHTLTQRQIKLKPRIKLNHNIYSRTIDCFVINSSGLQPEIRPNFSSSHTFSLT